MVLVKLKTGSCGPTLGKLFQGIDRGRLSGRPPPQQHGQERRKLHPEKRLTHLQK